MAAGVLPLSDRICRDFRVLRAATIAQTTIVAVALPFTVVYAQNPWLPALLIAIYGGRKIVQFLRNDRSLKQIRLEERFYRQQIDGSMLIRCLRRSEHLWDDSHILRALRAILARPIPTILSDDEKTRRLQQDFRLAFRSLIPPRVTIESILPLIALAWLLMQPLPQDPPLWLSSVIAGILILVILEIVQLRRRLLLRQRFGSYERALSRWTLGLSEFVRLHEHGPADYRHELLYRAEPIYSIGTGPERTTPTNGS